MYKAGQFVKMTGVPGTNLRSDPSTSSDANIIQGIPTGVVVPVVGDSVNGFANVTYLGATGYVSENYVAAASAQDVQTPRFITPGPYRITGSNVNVRSGPSLNDGILVVTGAVGETFVASGPAENGYAAGNYTQNGETYRGWIAEQYLGFGQDPASVVTGRPSLPVVTTKPSVPTTTVSQTAPPKPSGVVMVGGLLALAVVIYFMAK